MIASVMAARGQNTPQAPAFIDGPGSTLSQQPRPRIPRSPKLPYGLELMAHFDLLPTLRDTQCVQDSSYDRSGGNGDSGHFFRRDDNLAVLADIRGPGCIYRFWSANAAGQLRIYFDGEQTPRIDCPMQDLFLGKVAPFVQPIVGHRSGGWYCFFPMPFAKSCRIEVTDPGSMYYHVQYQLFPDGTPVRTFTRSLTPEDQAALNTVLSQWENLGAPPVSLSGDLQVEGKGPLTAGQTRTLATLQGPGEIESLRMKLVPADRFTLRQTVLRVYWDDADKPGIEAPIGDFFGSGFGDQRFKSLPDAMTDDGCVCYWPMPFARSARIEVANLGKTDVSDLTWSVSYAKRKRPLANVGYFHAQWHRQTTVAGEHFHILQTSGRGHYVGEHTDMQGDRGIGFLEGDEKIYVDGETFPSIYGTGTEDFYTGGWYFDEGPFNLAYHGCILKRDEMSRVGAYRYQIQDCVPFQRDIKVDIEHGGMNDYPGADYSCVAYWYQDTPAHDWSPIEAAQLTPARFKIADVQEAEDLKWTSGQVQVWDDSALPIEASGGKLAALAGDAADSADQSRATFWLHVDRDDVYRLHINELLLPDSPSGLTLFWPEKTSPPFSTTLEGPSGSPDRWDYSVPIRLTPGNHAITLATPAHKMRYVDYVRLEPAPKERGVIEAESLAEEAARISDGTAGRKDGIEVWNAYGRSVMEALSGFGLLEWNALKDGATLNLPISLPADGDYELELGVAMLSAGPSLTARFDHGDPIATLDLSKLQVSAASTADFRVQRVPVGRLNGVKQGAHVLSLTNTGSAAMLHLDYIRLQKSLYPNTVEAENLQILDARDGEATRQEMAGFGPGWSGEAQFFFIGQKPGAEATLELPIAVAGNYALSVYYTTARDYGVVQAFIDGQEIGGPTDCYTPNVLPKGKTDLGTLALAAGSHRLTFRMVGKNPASAGYLVGVDAIGVESREQGKGEREK